MLTIFISIVLSLHFKRTEPGTTENNFQTKSSYSFSIRFSKRKITYPLCKPHSSNQIKMHLQYVKVKTLKKKNFFYSKVKNKIRISYNRFQIIDHFVVSVIFCIFCAKCYALVILNNHLISGFNQCRDKKLPFS